MNTTTPSRTIKHAFVTGATGLLGNNLGRALLKENIHVTALIRSMDKAQKQFGSLFTLFKEIFTILKVTNPIYLTATAFFTRQPSFVTAIKVANTGKNSMILISQEQKIFCKPPMVPEFDKWCTPHPLLSSKVSLISSLMRQCPAVPIPK